MNVREVEYITIPVTNLDASLRFYHEVFDLPIIDLADGSKGAQLNKHFIKFKSVDHVEYPVEFGFVDKDTMDNIHSHLINYFVDIVDGPRETNELRRKATSITILDPDKNQIEITVFD
ncbi:VOC family protein [Lentilactobacillus sp. SPB1-3]|uniref:VOC family protein n=1 Tax=Lentilactobacillus terminaliae TaxID=3003483 RepID=A0ACD5DFG4_9LACO|nr:VOC family protein [Lentilactobacillus sp. SPB1-3]MCZ0976643.1 VOC family protein [Lentilactobacillus sp. SPB1-3]